MFFIWFSFWQDTSYTTDEVVVVGQGNGWSIEGMTALVESSEEVDDSLAVPYQEPTVEYCENGIKLNTKVPFIGDCIKFGNWTDEVNSTSAFPVLMWGLTKIMMTAILIFSFLMVIVWWTMMIAWWFKESYYGKGKDYVKNVLIALILLWTSGLILKLINPNFFWW